MAVFGHHASPEQFSPSALLRLLTAARDAGFASGMCSDHFAPWSTRQGHSGHAWPRLGAAPASTDLPMGVVTAPGQRYQPAVLAQAAATLAERAPGRLWPTLGTGQALNEHITGDRRPSEEQRTRRPEEYVRIMRALFAGEEVSHEGLVRVDRAKLRSLPERPPLLLGAAVGPSTARRAAAWADGIITVNRPDDARRETLAAYREGTTFG